MGDWSHTTAEIEGAPRAAIIEIGCAPAASIACSHHVGRRLVAGYKCEHTHDYAFTLHMSTDTGWPWGCIPSQGETLRCFSEDSFKHEVSTVPSCRS